MHFMLNIYDVSSFIYTLSIIHEISKSLCDFELGEKN